MSTSDQEKIFAGLSRRAEDTAVAENLSPETLAGVAAITHMANEFFRAVPGQSAAPASRAAAPPLSHAPSVGHSERSEEPQHFAGNATNAPGNPLTGLPTYETRLPQFGAPFPSVPSLPSAGALPGPGMHRFAGTEASALTPEQAAAPTTATPQYNAQSMAASSPFSMPMPPFEAAFPSFEMGLPDLVPTPLPTEEQVNAALASVSSFYFLEDARSLSKPLSAPPQPPKPASITPAVLPDLALPNNQFDIASVRRDFPILNERVNGHPLIWLDNAATTQKPQAVIDRLKYFYEHENSNIHRAAHELAARATDAYEDARTKVARFLNAGSSKEIVFVRGATEAINLIAQAWGRRHIQQGDEIIISWIEHHANIVPWQMLAAEKGAKLRVIPVDDDGQILIDEYEKLLNPRTRLVSFTQVSNALGTVTPAHQMIQMAHRYGARVLLDGAQAVSHMPIDVQSLDCDFFVFSGHKVFAPTGIGVVYGKPDALADTPPWQGGGNMIVDVTFEKTVYQEPPARFEAGTGNIADAVGLGAAIDYLNRIGMANIASYEHELLIYATRGLLTIPGLRLIGTAKEKAGVLSFVLDGFKTEEVGAALNREGIAVRSGHHCAQPSLRRMGVETTVRPSLALYNSFGDIDALVAALRRLKNLGA
ncbi:family 2A encapsulin nanocompartment cargo protein cysteine desulfurase [Edaphobacter sp.]|uniref:family 2A encapsulin nanocompartment cargo protein cysteine desulfurase n=1 Tax=Edaphobacter sp. TaxID=1934404 RepID=UPI002DBAEF1F|nr:family 2A encapsulin nanocompartment cargo protein cysteine desulfurase [Edaphobacter sp.]HEU5340795.1 family 2A encapsulin nanocompartment cargo protein cysteine desulfurase [Edaphobacter sp.]